MKNKFVNLLLKDRRIIKNSFFIICAILLVFFLLQYDRKLTHMMRQIEQQKQLTLRIPELEAEKKMLTARFGLSFTGVILGETPVAIINGVVLKKGDEIAGKKVAEIRQNSVLLSEGDETVELQLE